MSLSDYITAFSEVTLDATSRHKSPHNACLIISVMELIEENYITHNRIFLNEQLNTRYNQVFEKIVKITNKIDISQPFFNLQSASFWHHEVVPKQQAEYQQRTAPNQSNYGGINKVKALTQYAYLDDELFEYFKSYPARQTLKQALLNKLDDKQQQSILVPENGWNWFECELIVRDYFEMLMQELKGKPYNKAQHNRDLIKVMNESRTRGSIEKKHQNISAILNHMGMPIIDGYKPLSNYQRNILPDVVGAALAQNQGIQTLISLINKQTVEAPTVENILNVLEAKPPAKEAKDNQQKDKTANYNSNSYRPKKLDYLAQEAANLSLGLKGEEFVINYEKARLIYEGQVALADKIEHSSLNDDSLGYDIHSYSETGQDRFIEVKTTNYDRYTRFYISPNELNISKQLEKQYHLYRVFNFNRDPKLFISQGSLENGYNLAPSAYIANIK